MARMPDVPLYGASLEGVQDWLPTFTITDTSQPNATAVEGMLTFTSRWVANRLGDLGRFSADLRALTEANARGLVELGAAALTDKAAHPAQAGRGHTSYGDELWAMFLAGIDEALEALGKQVDEAQGPPAAVPGDTPAAYFPVARFWRDSGF